MKLSRRSFQFAALAAGLAFTVPNVAADEFRAAGVLPGSITDQAFNQQVYEGLQMAKERLGIEVAFSEKVRQADQVEALSDYARRGYPVVVAAGGEFTASAKRVADQNPDTLVVVLNGAPTEGLATINYDNEQFGYVLGYIGGKMSETGKAGIVAGQEFAAFLELADGFKKGWQAGQPDGDVFITYTNDWDDVAKAKEAALNLINQGVDVVVPYLDNGIVGVAQAASEQGIWAMGVITDLDGMAREAHLASTVLAFSEATATAVEMAKNGELERKDYRFGIGSPAGPMGKISDAVPAEVKAEVEAIIAEMQAGTFQP